MIERGRVIFLIVALMMRVNGSLLLRASGQRSHAAPPLRLFELPRRRNLLLLIRRLSRRSPQIFCCL